MAKAEQPSNFHRVAEFHRAFSLPVEPQPVVPDDATIRLRLALLLEEFHELAEATCQQPDADQQTFLDTLATAREQLASLKSFRVDMVEVADALTEHFGDAVEAKSTKLIWKPQNTIPVEGQAADTLMKLLDVLDDLDDVANVYDNSELSEAEVARLAES